MQDLTKFYRPFPALWIFLIFAFGITSGWFLLDKIDFNLIFYALIFVSLLSVISYFRYKFAFIYFVCTLLFLAGVFNIYYSLAAFAPNDLRVFSGKKITAVRGIISDCTIRENGKHSYILKSSSVQIDSINYPATGKIYLYQGKYSRQLHYGDEVEIASFPVLPPLPGNPGMFNFRRYLQLKEVFYQLRLSETNCKILDHDKGTFWKAKLLWPLREYILKISGRYLPQPTRGVVQAMMLGQRQNLERGVVQDFRRTGIVHILAISGLHVGFILLILLLFFGFLRFPFKAKIFASLFFLLLFTALVDFKAPVVRASLMAAFYFLAKMSQRKVQPLNIIAGTGLLILLVQPQQLLQPGFQFSFAAVGGIIYGYPRLNAYFPFRTGRSKIKSLVNKWLRQPFLVSAAAVLATTPLTWYYYGTLQLGAVIVNIFLLPLVGGFVIFSFIFILFVSLGIGLLPGFTAFLHYYFLGMLEINKFFAGLPFVQMQIGNPSLWSLLLFVICLFFLLNLTGRVRFFSFGAACLLLILSLSGILSPPRLQITFVNVGQGDGCIVQLPNKKVWLVDAGDRKFHFDAGRHYILPVLRYYGIKRIQYLVGSHQHSDHIGGFLSVLDEVKVDTLLLSGYPGNTKLYKNILQKARNKGVFVSFRQRGGLLNAGKDCRAYILHPYGSFLKGKDFSGKEVNNSSLVIKLVYGKTSFLLTGDLESSAEAALFSFKDLLRADVLKVGHHGSKTSSSAAFLDLIRPRLSVVSVGYRNKYFHPGKKTMARLAGMQAHPLRTDRVGAVVVQSDGRELQLLNWRKW